MFLKSAHRKDTIRAVVALLVCGGILAAFVVVLGGFRFWEKFDVYSIRFVSVKDLSVGRPVKYGGLDVGRILAIGVDPDDPRMIRVEVGIRQPMTLHKGVVARIAQKGLVGDYYVFLDPQDSPGAPIAPGSVIPSEESVDMAQLAGLAGAVLNDLRPKLDQMATSMAQIINSKNAERVSLVLDRLPVLVAELESTAKEIKTGWSGVTKDGRVLVQNASGTLREISTAVNALQNDARVTMGDLRQEMKRVGELTQSLQSAVNYDQAQLEDILENVNRLSGDLKHLSAKLRDRPWEVIRQPQGGAK